MSRSLDEILEDLNKIRQMLQRVSAALHAHNERDFDLSWLPDVQGPMLSHGFPAMQGQVGQRPIVYNGVAWHCACQCSECKGCAGYTDAVTSP